MASTRTLVLFDDGNFDGNNSVCDGTYHGTRGAVVPQGGCWQKPIGWNYATGEVDEPVPLLDLPRESDKLYDIKLRLRFAAHDKHDYVGSLHVRTVHKDGRATADAGWIALTRFVTSYWSERDWYVDLSEMRPVLLQPKDPDYTLQFRLHVANGSGWDVYAALELAPGDPGVAHPIDVVPLFGGGALTEGGVLPRSWYELSDPPDMSSLLSEDRLSRNRAELRLILSGHGSFEFAMYKHRVNLVNDQGTEQVLFDDYIWNNRCDGFFNCSVNGQPIASCLDHPDCFDENRCSHFPPGHAQNHVNAAECYSNVAEREQHYEDAKSREGWCPGTVVAPIHAPLDLSTYTSLDDLSLEYRIYSEHGNFRFQPVCQPHESCYVSADQFCADCAGGATVAIDRRNEELRGCYVDHQNTIGWSEYKVSSALIVYGEDPILDARTGIPYEVVRIGNQKWFARNLDLSSIGLGRCYDDNPANCAKHGSLHSWHQASDTRWEEGAHVPTLCPVGSVLPGKADWQALIEYAENNSMSGNAARALRLAADGDDDFDFSALLGGFFNINNNRYVSRGRSDLFWTRTQAINNGAGTTAWRVYLNRDDQYTIRKVDKNHAFSVRCMVK